MAVGVPPFQVAKAEDSFYRLMNSDPKEYKKLIDNVVKLEDNFIDFIH